MAVRLRFTVPDAPSRRGAGKRVGCYHATQRGRCGYGVATKPSPTLRRYQFICEDSGNFTADVVGEERVGEADLLGRTVDKTGVDEFAKGV